MDLGSMHIHIEAKNKAQEMIKLIKDTQAYFQFFSFLVGIHNQKWQPEPHLSPL